MISSNRYISNRGIEPYVEYFFYQPSTGTGVPHFKSLVQFIKQK